jgi:phage shock protein A
MRTLRRLTASIIASFEGVVGQLENHEAVVTAAIRDAEQAAGRAKAQLGRVKRDGSALQKRITELREQTVLWEDRAKRSRSIDEEKALECIKRRQRSLVQIQKLEEQHREHLKLERQLETDLLAVEEKLSTLRQQRNMMRTRESRAEAMRLTSSIDSSAIGHIDEIFERWEARVASAEEQNSFVDGTELDELAEGFATDEERHHLLALLDTIAPKASAPAGDSER